MSTFLGLLGVAAFIVAIVSLAAAVTWSVVRLTSTAEAKVAARTRTPSS